MFPVLIKLGPVSISTYGVLVAFGWLTGVRWLVSRRAAMGASEDQIWDLTYWVFGGAFVGGKVMYFLLTPGSFEFTFAALRFGFIFYGGLIGGLAAGLGRALYLRLSFLKLADWCVTALALGHGIGRFGCLAAGCCFGRHTDLPWGIRMVGDASRHPTQVYEAVLNLALFGLLARWALPRVQDGRWRPGGVLAAYVLGYAGLRFVVEFFRGDDRGVFIAGISPSQWVSLVLAAGTLAAFAARRKSR